MCRALQVSPSGYHAWRDRQPSARAVENQRLVQQIQQVHQETHEAYGMDRMWQALLQRGETCGRHRVARLRQAHAIHSRRRRRYLRRRGNYRLTESAT
nr:IS3 family transposase [Dyella flava]